MRPSSTTLIRLGAEAHDDMYGVASFFCSTARSMLLDVRGGDGASALLFSPHIVLVHTLFSCPYLQNSDGKEEVVSTLDSINVKNNNLPYT